MEKLRNSTVWHNGRLLLRRCDAAKASGMISDREDRDRSFKAGKPIEFDVNFLNGSSAAIICAVMGRSKIRGQMLCPANLLFPSGVLESIVAD